MPRFIRVVFPTVVLLCVLLSGCGSGSSSSNMTTPLVHGLHKFSVSSPGQYAIKIGNQVIPFAPVQQNTCNAGSFVAIDTGFVAIAAKAPTTITQIARDDFFTQVNATLSKSISNTLLPLTEDKTHIALYDNRAVVAFTLQPQPSETLQSYEQRLAANIDGINKNAGSSPDFMISQFDNTANQAAFHILGAANDWLMTAKSAGRPLCAEPCCQVGGSPAGTPQPYTFSKQAPTTSTNAQGDNTTVVVLDTAFPLSTSTSCSLTVTECFASAVPLTENAIRGTQQTDASWTAPPLLQDTLAHVEESSAVLNNVDDSPYFSGDSLPMGLGAQPANIVNHGLYISSLIHQLAGHADIRLVRVLNDYGVGDVKTVADALDDLINQPTLFDIPTSGSGGYSGTVILNMSMSLSPPIDCMPDIEQALARNDRYFDITTCYTELATRAKKNEPLLDTNDPSYRLWLTSLLPIQQRLDVLRQRGVIIVAAAGNDSETGLTLDPDIPAAFCGVHAATSTDAAATFANAGSINQNGTQDCLDVSSPTVENSVRNGLIPSPTTDIAPATKICGLYVPQQGESFPSGFAQWQGTSFAAGIVSGVEAAGGDPTQASHEEAQVQCP